MIENIVKNLNGILSARGLTATGLEKKAGLRRASISNILRGASKNPSLETLVSIANALDCTIHELLENTNIPHYDYKSQKLSHSKKPEDINCIPNLFIEVAQYVIKLLAEKASSISLNKAIKVIEEVYVYSLNNNGGKLSTEFAQWFINKI